MTVPKGTALLGLGTVLALAGIGLMLWPGPRVDAEVGSLQVPAVGDTARSSAPETEPAPTPEVDPLPAAGFVPERLTVATLDLDAPLLPTTVDADGALVPPDDPADLGWWRGVKPGEGEGSVIVAGHIDSRRYGQGPLGRIVDLEPGEVAVVTGVDGEQASYAVRGVETYVKEDLPADELFGTSGPERLVLVTCGGTFDPERSGWDSNIVAILDPLPPG